MKTKPLLVITAVAVAVLGVGYYIILPQLVQNRTVVAVADKLFGWQFPISATRLPSTGSTLRLRDPGGITQGLPVRLKIPIIGVDSAIEDALITPEGRMDVPNNSVNVAWFALGPHPGAVGSAVIGGHFGITNGVPWVFYKLDQLKVGDKIYIINDKDDTLAFIVRSITLLDRTADGTAVFTSQDGLAHLNLITCEGIWNAVNGTYAQRRVVFTDAIKAEDLGKAESSNDANVTFYRSLDVGAKGADVEALQNTLEKKGFLIMPLGIAKGLFGPLTRVAIAKYQTSKGLPSVGVFGPLTRARFILDLGESPVLPNTGIEIATLPGTKKPLSQFEIFILAVKSLYTTPLDGLITIFLIVSIIFVAFKIIRR